MHHLITTVLFESDCIYEVNCNRVYGVIDALSLIIRDKNVEYNSRERNSLRPGILRPVCQERKHKGAVDKEKRVLIQQMETKFLVVLTLNLFTIKIRFS